MGFAWTGESPVDEYDDDESAIAGARCRGVRRRDRRRRRLVGLGPGHGEAVAGYPRGRRAGHAGGVRLQPVVPQLELLRRVLERHPTAADVLLVESGAHAATALLAGRRAGHRLGGTVDRQLGPRVSGTAPRRLALRDVPGTGRALGVSRRPGRDPS